MTLSDDLNTWSDECLLTSQSSDDGNEIDFHEHFDDDDDTIGCQFLDNNEDEEFIEQQTLRDYEIDPFVSILPPSSEWANDTIRHDHSKDVVSVNSDETSSINSHSTTSTKYPNELGKLSDRHRYSVSETKTTKLSPTASPLLHKIQETRKCFRTRFVRRSAGTVHTAVSSKTIAANIEAETLRQSHIDSVRKTLALASFPIFHVPSIDFFSQASIIPIHDSSSASASAQSTKYTYQPVHGSHPNVCFWDHHALDEEGVTYRAGDLYRPGILRRGRKSIPISRIKKPCSLEVLYTFFGCFCSWECAHSFQSLYFSGKYTDLMLLARKEIDGVPILTPLRQHPHPFVLKRYGGDYSIERFRHWWTEELHSDALVQTVNNGDVSYVLNSGTQIFGVTDVCDRQRKGGGFWCEEVFGMNENENISDATCKTNWVNEDLCRKRETAISACMHDIVHGNKQENATMSQLPPLQCGRRLRRHILLVVSLFNVPFIASNDSAAATKTTITRGIASLHQDSDIQTFAGNGKDNNNSLSTPTDRKIAPKLRKSQTLSANDAIHIPAPTLVVRINDEPSRKATLHQNQMDELIHLDYVRRVKKRESVLSMASSPSSSSPSSSSPLPQIVSPSSSPKSIKLAESQMSNASHGFQRVHDAPKYVRKAIDASVKKKTEIHSMLYNASPHSLTTRGNHRVQKVSSEVSTASSVTSASSFLKKRGKKSVEESALEAFEKNDESKDLLETVLNAAVLHTNKANDYLDLSTRGGANVGGGGGEVTFDANTGTLTVSGRSAHVSRSSDLAMLVNAGGDGVAAIRAAMAYANADAYFDVGISHKRKRKRRDASLCESLEQLAETLNSEKDQGNVI